MEKQMQTYAGLKVINPDGAIQEIKLVDGGIPPSTPELDEYRKHYHWLGNNPKSHPTDEVLR